MIRLLTLEKRVQLKSHVFLFQSRFFEKEFPPEVREFENLILVEAVGRDRDASLMKMREAMIGSHDFAAGIFIGGMEGVEKEYELFRRMHPKKPAFPIASTGAAARILFDNFEHNRQELLNDLRYLHLFRRLLGVKE